MNCPACNVALAMTAREGVEIDYCPQCRGVWLDRGELDKIIARSQAIPSSDRVSGAAHQTYAGRDDDDDWKSGRQKHRRKSFLGDLFDFD